MSVYNRTFLPRKFINEASFIEDIGSIVSKITGMEPQTHIEFDDIEKREGTPFFDSIGNTVRDLSNLSDKFFKETPSVTICINDVEIGKVYDADPNVILDNAISKVRTRLGDISEYAYILSPGMVNFKKKA